MLGTEDQFGRHHGVQHHGARAVRMPAQVFERNTRPVRNTHEVVLRYAERRADRLEVCDVIAGRVEARIRRRPQLTQTLFGEFARYSWLDQVSRLDGFGPWAVERVRSPGAALVDQDHVALAQHAMKRGGDLRKSLQGGLPRAAGQHHDRVGLGPLARRRDAGDLQVDRATVGPAAVLRHSQRAALCRHGGWQPRLGKRAWLELDRARRSRHRGGRRRRRSVCGHQHCPQGEQEAASWYGHVSVGRARNGGANEPYHAGPGCPPADFG